MTERFYELRKKEIINVLDGRRLGSPIDIEICLADGTIRAIIVPGPMSLRGFFQKPQQLVIPWSAIVRIGDDVILVQVDPACFVQPT